MGVYRVSWRARWSLVGGCFGPVVVNVDSYCFGDDVDALPRRGRGKI